MDFASEQVVYVKTKLLVPVACFEVKLGWINEAHQKIDDLVGEATGATKSKLIKYLVFLLHEA